MKISLLIPCLILLALVSLSTQARERVCFDRDWRFMLGDDAAAQDAGYDDSDWRLLDLPHDWAYEADYSPGAAQGDKGGYKPGGIGWYRKSFEVPADWSGKCVRIDFDAVYMNSEVWINGVHLGKYPYGYNSFSYDLTEHIRPGENTIAVRVDNSREPSARWYHGCGIYAHVYLVASDPIHIVKDGVYVTTPEIGDDHALVAVETRLANRRNAVRTVRLATSVLDPEGRIVARSESEVSLAAEGEASCRQRLRVPQPRRWDIDSPALYRVESRVIADGAELDRLSTRFGIREIRWEAESGFWLNGRNIKLKGVCEHLEGGPLGAALPDELIRWKIEQLKEMGCNAIRTAHNPQVPEFYRYCDELGMLVMDEIFDGWSGKAPEDYGSQAFDEWWERDLRAWLKRDRNHPSIVIWSLGNETRGDVAKQMVAICHELDPSRPTTSGHSSSQYMDVLGVNGHSEFKHFIDKLSASERDKPFVSTEAPHTWQTRGFYRSRTWWRDGRNVRGAYPCPDLSEQEIFRYDWIAPAQRDNTKQVFNSSYDNAMVRITARKNWELARDLPWHSGHFRWTGFDYLGEAGYVHGSWPFRLFMGGALDTAGFRKDLFYFYQSQWTAEPMLHILPSWTHPEMPEGTAIPVWAYSNCDEVELFLNGESLGRKRPGRRWDEMQCEWMVPWRPGRLEAVGYRKGKVVARAVQITAAEPAGLMIDVEQNARCPIITVSQIDRAGVENPYAENTIHYHIDGPARILGLDSGNPVDTSNNIDSSYAAFFGKTRAFLEFDDDESDIAMVIGAICGDKNLRVSDLISIDLETIALRGELPDYELHAFYSTDGKRPQSRYAEPFRVSPGSQIRVEVYDGERLLMTMSEEFGPGAGLFWGESEAAIDEIGEQAEDARFKGAEVSTQGEGFQGRGYLDFGHKKDAYVEWFQENDGGPMKRRLQIRYSGHRPTAAGRPMQLAVNGQTIRKRLFFPNTADYGRDWKTVETEIELQPGANTIRLSTIEAGGMVIDEMRLVD